MEPTGSRLVLYGDVGAEFHIWDIADIHLGNRGCAKHVLERDVARIANDPYALWQLGGDYCDFISPTDPRFDPECVDDTMMVNDLAQMSVWLLRRTLQFIEPIKGKCLGACMGNHEMRYLTQTSQMNIHQAMCDALDAHNMKYSGMYDLYFEHCPGVSGCVLIKRPKADQLGKSGQVKLRVFVHHGFSAATTSGGRINALARMLQNVEADLVMLGHMHEKIAKEFVRLGADESCQVIKARSSLGLVTGTYLRTYAANQSGYGEIRGYPPTTLGAARATFIPDTLTLSVENRAEVGTRF